MQLDNLIINSINHLETMFPLSNLSLKSEITMKVKLGTYYKTVNIFETHGSEK